MPGDVTSEIVVVGAGISGIGAAISLRRAGFDDFVVLERAGDIGGTWRDSVYPGLTCDVPALTYSFSSDQKPDWSSIWAPQEEILGYLRGCVDRHRLWPHLRFGCDVLEARYDEQASCWRVRTADGAEVVSRFLINASGFLNVAKWPSIPGFDLFTGQKIHPSQWPHDVDLREARIGFIGTGATAIQLAPELAPVARQLSIFQRTPIWLLPKPRLRVPAGLHAMWRRAPATQRAASLMTAAFMDLVFWRAFTDYDQVRLLGRAVESLARRHIRRQVDDPELATKLTLSYSWGCKRPSFSNVFYPIFNRDNVELVTERIERITPAGIVTADGTERAIDVLICATGYQPFAPNTLPTYPVYGRDGVELREHWFEHRYQAFRGFAMFGFPNYFVICGPYSIASTSYFTMVELAMRNISRLLSLARQERADYVEVRRQAQSEDWEYVIGRKASSIWAVANCASSNTYYLDRFGDTPQFRPTYSPGEWWRARRFDGRRYFQIERRGLQAVRAADRVEHDLV